MAKYGLFERDKTPIQEFEGDSMAQNADHVYIYKKRPGGAGHGDQVAAIKLGDGQSVKLISS